MTGATGISSPVPVLSEAGFLAWIDCAALGERIAYHEGLLGVDQVRGPSSLPEPVRDELDRVAGLALALADTGHLLLAQRRIDADRVAYLAIKAAKPRQSH